MNADFNNNIRKRVAVSDARYLEADQYVDPDNDPKYRGGGFKRQSTLVDQYDVVERAIENDADVQAALNTQTNTYLGASEIGGAAISDTTSAAGDVTIAHGMAAAPTSAVVVSSGTDANYTEIQSIDATNIVVRFYDDTGTAINAGAVTGYWMAFTA